VLVGLQGLAYLAVYRGRALRTWPTGLAFAPALGAFVLKSAALARFAQPGVSWLEPLRLADLPKLAAFAVGAPVVAIGVALWVCIGVATAWRGSRVGQASTHEDAHGAIFTTALIAVLAWALCVGLGFLRPMVTARYLTPETPGLLLGLALLADRFERSWAIMPVLLVAGFAGLCLGLLIHPPRLKAVFSFQPASERLMADGARHMAFMWDNPATQGGDLGQLAQVAGFFFNRAGRSIPIDVVTWTPAADPNKSLLARARGPYDALIWIYDRNVPGTLAISHPPRLTQIDPSLTCRDFGGGGIGVLACDRRKAPG
jgi:hypothetical protein